MGPVCLLEPFHPMLSRLWPQQNLENGGLGFGSYPGSLVASWSWGVGELGGLAEGRSLIHLGAASCSPFLEFPGPSYGGGGGAVASPAALPFHGKEEGGERSRINKRIGHCNQLRSVCSSE